jgi:hypothetical protein
MSEGREQAWQKYTLYRYDTNMALKWRYPITSIDTDLHTWCLRLVRWNTHTFDLRTTLRIILICLLEYDNLDPLRTRFYRVWSL